MSIELPPSHRQVSEEGGGGRRQGARRPPTQPPPRLPARKQGNEMMIHYVVESILILPGQLAS